MAAYLCLVSLVEGEVADYPAMLDLVTRYNSDIRRSLLQLQYLVASGGLQSPPTQPHKRKQVSGLYILV